MRVAILHYHLRTGGVTRVISHAVQALQQQGHDVLVVAGEAAAPEVIDSLGKVAVVSALRYGTRADRTDAAETVKELLVAAEQHLGGPPDVWHIHNHTLGKNSITPCVVRRLARQGARLLLQIHDFAEDGRPANYRRMVDELTAAGEPLDECLYPQAPNVQYAVLNGRDRMLLSRAGIAADRLHQLANAVHVDMDLGDEGAVAENDHPVFLYPTRAIRRKNVGEFLYWAAVGGGTRRFLVSRAPRNPEALPYYNTWVALAAELDLPVEFAAGEQAGLSFEQLVRSADVLVTTSVAEGFGLAFLEPWLLGRPLVGRNLPEITGEFSDAGIALDALYSRLDVPVSWVGEDALREAFCTAWTKVLEAYDRMRGKQDTQRFMNEAVRDGQVDFGRLDETMQAVVIRQLAQRGPDRERFRLLWGGEDNELIVRNRQAVERHFGLVAYGRRLTELYDYLVQQKPEAPEGLSPGAVLDAFLAPERLMLLRT